MALSALSDFGLADHANVWRADALAQRAGAVQGTGHAALDAELPGGGWPVGAMTELLQAQTGQGEWRLLLPALRQLTGPVVLVGPPHVPFAPGLAAQGLNSQRLLWIATQTPAAHLWACEQALRCADVSAVLAWLTQSRTEQLRRLQMAASEHGKLLFVMRAAQAAPESSPAVLRLLLASPVAAGHASDDLLLHILKRRGPPLERVLRLPARAARLAALLALPRSQPGSSDALDCAAIAA